MAELLVGQKAVNDSIVDTSLLGIASTSQVVGCLGRAGCPSGVEVIEYEIPLAVSGGLVGTYHTDVAHIGVARIDFAELEVYQSLKVDALADKVKMFGLGHVVRAQVLHQGIELFFASFLEILARSNNGDGIFIDIESIGYEMLVDFLAQVIQAEIVAIDEEGDRPVALNK